MRWQCLCPEGNAQRNEDREKCGDWYRMEAHDNDCGLRNADFVVTSTPLIECQFLSTEKAKHEIQGTHERKTIMEDLPPRKAETFTCSVYSACSVVPSQDNHGTHGTHGKKEENRCAKTHQKQKLSSLKTSFGSKLISNL